MIDVAAFRAWLVEQHHEAVERGAEQWSHGEMKYWDSREEAFADVILQLDCYAPHES